MNHGFVLGGHPQLERLLHHHNKHDRTLGEIREMYFEKRDEYDQLQDRNDICQNEADCFYQLFNFTWQHYVWLEWEERLAIDLAKKKKSSPSSLEFWLVKTKYLTPADWCGKCPPTYHGQGGPTSRFMDVVSECLHSYWVSFNFRKQVQNKNRSALLIHTPVG